MSDGFSTRASTIGIAGPHVAHELCGNHNAIARALARASGKIIAKNFFAVALVVHVGAINKVAAGLQVLRQHGATFVNVGSNFPFIAKGHGAKAHWANAQTGSTKRDVILQ